MPPPPAPDGFLSLTGLADLNESLDADRAAVVLVLLTSVVGGDIDLSSRRSRERSLISLLERWLVFSIAESRLSEYLERLSLE